MAGPESPGFFFPRNLLLCLVELLQIVVSGSTWALVFFPRKIATSLKTGSVPLAFPSSAVKLAGIRAALVGVST